MWKKVVIADNNILSGPSIVKSHTIIGRYPSLEDLFKRMEDEEEQVEEYSENIDMVLEDVQELVEELELELLNNENFHLIIPLIEISYAIINYLLLV